MPTVSDIISNIKDSINHIPYTIKHIVWVNKIAWNNFNTIYPLHDLDKVVLYVLAPYVGTDAISKWHRSYSRHHDNNKVKSDRDYIEMVCDWESARFTKPDKPLNATDTAKKFYPHLLGVLDKYLKTVNK